MSWRYFPQLNLVTLCAEENWDLASRVKPEGFEIGWAIANIWLLFILYVFLSSDDELEDS